MIKISNRIDCCCEQMHSASSQQRRQISSTALTNQRGPLEIAAACIKCISCATHPHPSNHSHRPTDLPLHNHTEVVACRSFHRGLSLCLTPCAPCALASHLPPPLLRLLLRVLRTAEAIRCASPPCCLTAAAAAALCASLSCTMDCSRALSTTRVWYVRLQAQQCKQGHTGWIKVAAHSLDTVQAQSKEQRATGQYPLKTHKGPATGLTRPDTDDSWRIHHQSHSRRIHAS
jgi:hypothetical protein